jgi:hypothetical protein
MHQRLLYISFISNPTVDGPDDRYAGHTADSESAVVAAHNVFLLLFMQCKRRDAVETEG